MHFSFERLTKSNTRTEYIYHYVYNIGVIDKIIDSRKLQPVNITRDVKSLAMYAERVASQDPDEYFKDLYDKFYLPVVKKQYTNYGIYSTTMDFLMDLDLNIVCRIRIPITVLPVDNTVIQIGANVKLFSEQLYRKIRTEYSDVKKVETIYSKGGLHFKRLPQVVCFDDELRIERDNITYRNNQ